MESKPDGPEHPEFRKAQLVEQKMLESLWGRFPWPQKATQDFASDVINRLRLKPNHKCLVFGGRVSDVVRRLAEQNVSVIDAHTRPSDLPAVASKLDEFPNVTHFHGEFSKLKAEGKINGGVVLSASTEASDLPRQFANLSAHLADDATVVVADYAGVDEPQPALLSTSHPAPTKEVWHRTFSDAGLELLVDEDRTIDAIATMEKFIQRLATIAEGNPSASIIALRVAQEKARFTSGKKSWRVWTLRKTKPPKPTLMGSARPPVGLIMISGGIDSVYALHDALTNTDHDIIAHHINFINIEGRLAPEHVACRKILEWSRTNLREFGYSESTLDRRTMNYYGFDLVAVAYEAGLVAQSFRFRENRPVDYWRGGYCLEDQPTWKKRDFHMDAACCAASYPFEPPDYLYVPLLSKRAEVEALPEELVRLTWGCRRPVVGKKSIKPCGKCKTCRERAELGL